MKHLLSSLIILIIAALGTPTSALAARNAFQPTTIENGKFADDTHWYSINVRNGKYLYVDESTLQVCCSFMTAPTAERTEFLWAFTGSDSEGYHFYNSFTGAQLSLGCNNVDGNTFPTMSADAVYNTFRLKANGDGFSACVDGFTDVYLNDKGGNGYIGIWASTQGATSDGSRMVFTEVEMPGGGGTIDPDPGQTDYKLYSTLSNLISEAQTAYDANSTYTYGDGLIRTESQLYSEFSQNDLGTTTDGGSLAALIDQDPSTYWHSYWQGGQVQTGSHYIRVQAPTDLSTFDAGDYTLSVTYRDGGNDHPTQFTVYGTNSLTSTGGWGGRPGGGGSNTAAWTQVGTINLDFGGRGTTSTTTLSLATAYKYLRFNCTATSYNRGYFHLAEFQLYNDERTLSPSCPNAIYPQAAAELASAIATAEEAIEEYNRGGNIAQSDIDALQQALDAYHKAIPILATSLSITPTSIVSRDPGSQHTITATLQPSNASNPTLQWSSSNTSVATVSQTGLVTTTGTGSCTITARTTDGTGLTATCNVSVYGQADYSALCINEIQVANIDQYLDPSFNYGGWIELYNSGDTDIPLEGLYVVGESHSGKAEAPFQFLFPDDSRYDYGAVPAHGFKNIWFDHYAVYPNKPITEHEAYKQVDWKLDIDGGRVALLATDGHTEICSLQYPAMPPRSSYARTTDGGDTWGFHVCGTPAQSNAYATGYIDTAQRLPAPEVSTESQVLTGAVTTFTVTIPDGATLRYTTDGSTPTSASQQSKDGRFTVQSYASQTYRFRLFKDGWLSSPVVTRSFIYNYKNSGYNLPILVVSTDNDGLNNSEYGILTKSSPNGRTGLGSLYEKSNRNMDWERPINFEYFDLKDGNYECVINHEADIAVAGGWSRYGYTPPPFKIKAAEQYEGHKYFHYPVFKDKPYNKNRVLQLRHETDLLDVGLQEVARRSGLYIDTQAWEPGELYINGTSYGYIPVREPNNKHFALANYGIDTDEIDVFEVTYEYNYEQSAGTIDAFNRWYELAEQCGTSDEAYRALCELVDIDEYLNYMACEFYIFNTDWPWNNVKGFRGHDGKFHMVLMDVGDQAFDHTQNHAAGLSPFEYFRKWQPQHYCGYGETRFVTIFFNMMQNEQIRRRFVDTFCLVAYSVYDPTFISEVMADLRAKCNNWVDDTLMASRMTSSWQANTIKQLVALPEAGITTNDVFSINMQSNLAEARLSVNGLPVPRQRFSGQLFAPVTLSAQAPEGYDFAGWTDATGNVLSTDADWTITTGGRQQLGSVYARFTPAATLAAVPPVRINEVSASNGIYVNEYWDRKDWVELYNTTDQPIDVAGMYLSDKPENPRKWQIPAASQGNTTSASTASTVIPAHGTLIVWCDKEAAGPQLHASFKLSAESGSTVSITAADGSWTDVMTYKAHGERQTFGRYPDGGSQTYVFSQPTIDNSNRYGSYDYLLQIESEETKPASIADIARAIADALRGNMTLQEINDLVFRLLRNE